MRLMMLLKLPLARGATRKNNNDTKLMSWHRLMQSTSYHLSSEHHNAQRRRYAGEIRCRQAPVHNTNHHHVRIPPPYFAGELLHCSVLGTIGSGTAAEWTPRRTRERTSMLDDRSHCD